MKKTSFLGEGLWKKTVEEESEADDEGRRRGGADMVHLELPGSAPPPVNEKGDPITDEAEFEYVSQAHTQNELAAYRRLQDPTDYSP